MNALTKIENTALTAMTEQELVQVLQASLYPGAKLESIKMVLGYCKAAGLDPMQKPVHIVPMKVSSGEKDERGWDIKVDRDVIMPGVGLYRTQASRTGAYAGVSDPEFGPTRQLKYTTERWVDNDHGSGRKKVTSEATLEYPEWCRVIVTRIVDGVAREFSAREYWLENYATKGANSEEPNAMWKKRPFGQIAKCAEAQALRKAFPEMTGSQPTAEEMEGKVIGDFEEAGGVVGATHGRKPAVSMPQAKRAEEVSDAVPKGDAPTTTGAPAAKNDSLATEGERNHILKKANTAGVEVAALMQQAGITGLPADLTGLTKDGFIALKDALAAMA